MGRRSAYESETSPAVHLWIESITEMVDLGPRASWKTPLYPRPRIHVEKGTIGGANFTNSQLSGKYPRGGPHVVRYGGFKGEGYCPVGAPTHWLIRNFSDVQPRLKSVTDMVDLGPRSF